MVETPTTTRSDEETPALVVAGMVEGTWESTAVTESEIDRKLRELVKHRQHIRKDSDLARILKFLYPNRQAIAREIALGTGVDSDLVYQRLSKLMNKDRQLVVRRCSSKDSPANSVDDDNLKTNKYVLTDEGRWFALACTLDLTLLELSFLSFANRFLRLSMNPSLGLPRSLCMTDQFDYFDSIRSHGHIQNAIREIGIRGYVKRIGHHCVTTGSRFSELDKHTDVLENLLLWLSEVKRSRMEINKEKDRIREANKEWKETLRIFGRYIAE